MLWDSVSEEDADEGLAGTTLSCDRAGGGEGVRGTMLSWVEAVEGLEGSLAVPDQSTPGGGARELASTPLLTLTVSELRLSVLVALTRSEADEQADAAPLSASCMS